MNHPDLEKQLRDLQEAKERAAADIRDLANEAVNNADRASKSMMMQLMPAGVKDGCECKGQFCLCNAGKPKASTRKLIRKFKKALKSDQPVNKDV